MQSGDESSTADDWTHWDDHPQTIEEIQVMLQKAKDAALKREKALANAFSHQVFPLPLSATNFLKKKKKTFIRCDNECS